MNDIDTTQIDPDVIDEIVAEVQDNLVSVRCYREHVRVRNSVKTQACAVDQDMSSDQVIGADTWCWTLVKSLHARVTGHRTGHVARWHHVITRDIVKLNILITITWLHN